MPKCFKAFAPVHTSLYIHFCIFLHSHVKILKLAWCDFAVMSLQLDTYWETDSDRTNSPTCGRPATASVLGVRCRETGMTHSSEVGKRNNHQSFEIVATISFSCTMSKITPRGIPTVRIQHLFSFQLHLFCVTSHGGPVGIYRHLAISFLLGAYEKGPLMVPNTVVVCSIWICIWYFKCLCFFSKWITVSFLRASIIEMV